ncbi:MAG: carboxypeptidase-like regulatory domain-containing protein [Bacteroidales bacterium]|jgi:hypothetical protein
MKQSLLFLILFLFLSIPGFPQRTILKGLVKDELSSNPIPGVNIKIEGTIIGTPTDKTGEFRLIISKLPVNLLITCIGYEDALFKIRSVSETKVEFLLRPKSYSLPTLDISYSKALFLFKDKNYSVLDYELMNGNILLLVYKNQLKRSELVLLTRDGDTLAVSDLPEPPSASLYKDFLANVHYCTNGGNAYQCYYNEQKKRIDFLYKTTMDSLILYVRPFLFRIADRLYFQEKMANGFATGIGYYQKGKEKTYIRKCAYISKLKEYFDDKDFYNGWNTFYSSNAFAESLRPSNILQPDEIFETDPELDFSISRIEGGTYGAYEARAHKIEYFNMIFPVIKTKDNIIEFFNFGSDIIEFMDTSGKIIRTVPISFHKEIKAADSLTSKHASNSGWRWGTKIFTDDYSNKVYTIFLKNGKVKIRNLNMESGKLDEGTEIPYYFPEKITIYGGDAYFLIKNTEMNDCWDLVKYRVD